MTLRSSANGQPNYLFINKLQQWIGWIFEYKSNKPKNSRGMITETIIFDFAES